MDEPFLVVISLTMFVGSYLAGCIPLFFVLNERRIRFVSIFGAGLLVGTALCVIIPEGVSTLIESGQPHHHQNDGVIGENGKNTILKPMIQIERSTEMQHNREQRKEKLTIESQGIEEAQKKYIEGSAGIKEDASQENPDPPKYEKEHKVRKREIMEKHNEDKIDGNNESETTGRNLDGPIGVSLLVGFLFMFVIDQLAKMSHSRNKTLSTLGLVIHAFADGIAMGSASSAGEQLEMQMLVFIAIMLHKAPAAFALVSILLAQGLEKARIRRHLLVFSLAAPIGTVLTYTFLHMTRSNTPTLTPGGVPTDEASSHFTGIILLFSAGTFLYIATVHVLPELIDSKCGNSREGMTGSRELLLGGHASGLAGPISSLSLSETCLFCASALIPAFISSTSHGHKH